MRVLLGLITSSYYKYILYLTFNFWQEKPDDYDKLVKQMGLEMRARPSDRTKTPEEIAQEEKERLEQLEVWLRDF